jgi:hypothetical protein
MAQGVERASRGSARNPNDSDAGAPRRAGKGVYGHDGGSQAVNLDDKFQGTYAKKAYICRDGLSSFRRAKSSKVVNKVASWR